MTGARAVKKKITDLYDAINSHELARFMSAWGDDGVFIYPGEIPSSGTFQGKGAVEEWFRKFFEQFTKIQFDIQDVCVRSVLGLGGSNIVAVHWNLHLTNREGRVGQNNGVTVFKIKDASVVQMKDFIFDLGRNFRLHWNAA
jgi:ketosteroid isomerase-like protein